MSLTHMKGTTAHLRAAIVLCAMLAAWSTAALAQVTTTRTKAASRASTARCVGCTDSARARRVLLATKLDSLRMNYERRHLTTAEREVLAKEMASTILALEELIDASMRASFSEMRVQDFPRATTGGVRRSLLPGQVTVTAQTGSNRGYLGVTFDGPMYRDDDGRELAVRFFDYPLIASVDPSSPAERAGVLRGDTLIALNGTDVIDHLFSFTKLLVPDEKVTMKVRRQGDAKEFRIVVGEAPEYAVRRVPFPPMAYAPGEVRVGAVPVPRARGGTQPPDAPEPSVAFAYPGRVLFLSAAVGGARLEAVSEGLAKNLGVKGGLHVSRVAPGSPSEQWGLVEGDIILTVAGETMSVVQDFARLVADRNRTSDGVKIVILRDQKQQELILK